MNEQVGAARIAQWYRRSDKGEAFVVTAIDETTGAIEVQTFDGDIDEIDGNSWSALPLEMIEPPEDWSGALDVAPEVAEEFESETGTMSEWVEESGQSGRERWEDTTPEDELDPLGDGVPTEDSLIDHPQAAQRLR